MQTGTLPYSSLLSLLQENHAYLTETSIISYYDREFRAYRSLRPEDSLDASEITELEVLIKGSIESEVGCLIDRISDLEKKVLKLEQRLGIHEEPMPSPSPEPQQIDIAMLYAAPLVRVGVLRDKDCGNWNVDFAKERRKLLEVLEKNKIHATIKFEFATLENLSAVMECKPKIIHISCHGYYKKTAEKEFVLAFESSKKIGTCDEVTPTRLQNILQPFINYEGIVIVSACHSQAIGHVFLDAGVKYVITIHDQCKIHDEAAIEFSVIFYRNLFKGKTISQSFIEAKNGVTEMQASISACCCVHNHPPTCQAKNKGHEEHTPNHDCMCKH